MTEIRLIDKELRKRRRWETTLRNLRLEGELEEAIANRRAADKFGGAPMLLRARQLYQETEFGEYWRRSSWTMRASESTWSKQEHMEV